MNLFFGDICDLEILDFGDKDIYIYFWCRGFGDDAYERTIRLVACSPRVKGILQARTEYGSDGRTASEWKQYIADVTNWRDTGVTVNLTSTGANSKMRLYDTKPTAVVQQQQTNNERKLRFTSPTKRFLDSHMEYAKAAMEGKNKCAFFPHT